MVAAAAYGLRKDGIFACQAGSYRSDRYLSYCQAVKYADYDHGAIWYGLEPEANAAAAAADVMFIGNSRTQFGFSSDTTDAWFAALPARYYLLGFSHYENYTFEAPLLRRILPKARAYVINIDSFFEKEETPPGKMVMHEAGAEGRYRQKRMMQQAHRAICGTVAAACRDEYTIFRSRPTGSWVVAGGRFKPAPVAYDETVDSAMVKAYTAAGAAYLPTLPVERSCVILTVLPTLKTGAGTARAIAAGLGLTFVAPEPAGLNTFDGIHLDRPSAERWSAAFLAEAGPALTGCVRPAATVASEAH